MTSPVLVLLHSPLVGPLTWRPVATQPGEFGYRIAHALPHRVAALIYVDSLLPHPGETWLARAPQPLVEHLRNLVRDGLLPP